VSARSFAASFAMGAGSFAIFNFSGLVPRCVHPGKRVNRALKGVRDASRGGWLERRVLASRWRCYVLQRYVLGLDRDALHQFFEERVRYDGSTWPLDERRPLILAAPHYGAATVGLLAAVHRMHRRRPVNLFFDTDARKRHVARLLDSAGIDVAQLHSGFAGSVEALRALRRRECLIMMPDVFDHGAQTVVVPFYGRLLRVAAGTAFLALRSNALVVPVFATASRRITLDVKVDTAIDARRFSGDEPQKIFALSHTLFMRFESAFRSAPQHWRGWETLSNVSSEIDPAYRLDYDEPLQVLRARCESLPHLLEEIPELDLICR
jgi:hypothetical protein